MATAVLAGATIGGVAIAGPYLFGRIAMLGAEALSATLLFALYILGAAGVVWAVGLSVAGLPVWWVLHQRGLRGWRTAALIGFLLPFAVTLALAALASRTWGHGMTGETGDNGGLTSVNGVLTSHGWANQVRSSAWLGVVGVLIAVVIRKIAYRGRPAG